MGFLKLEIDTSRVIIMYCRRSIITLALFCPVLEMLLFQLNNHFCILHSKLRDFLLELSGCHWCSKEQRFFTNYLRICILKQHNLLHNIHCPLSKKLSHDASGNLAAATGWQLLRY